MTVKVTTKSRPGKYKKGHNKHLQEDSVCKCGNKMNTAYFHLVKRIWQCEVCMIRDDIKDRKNEKTNKENKRTTR